MHVKLAQWANYWQMLTWFLYTFPDVPSTRNFMAKEQFAQMKEGAIFINAARGTCVVIEDLADAIKSGHIAGAAVDVFPKEPKANGEEFVSPLRNLPNVILTPHVGGSDQWKRKRTLV